ncbi:phytosulfokines-like [Prunus yedoensis var. nudiflora]|uniref:Phytosulfokine n=1 Tax=Prunus yedoensis var. nudiflora TaxID=2094558 RepID=A0A314Y850_PRUYE|nr:phytosulfokines-like [Prunus yedoensis var. nudiflora]PQQ21995.1 phytosulfokines-like [Prunus yedoensis var. nudiflora]
MASKLTSLCFIALILFLSLSCSAARPLPSASDANAMKAQDELKDVEVEKAMVEESCEGVGEEECLMRRTLAAHVDYIYTQKHNP